MTLTYKILYHVSHLRNYIYWFCEPSNNVNFRVMTILLWNTMLWSETICKPEWRVKNNSTISYIYKCTTLRRYNELSGVIYTTFICVCVWILDLYFSTKPSLQCHKPDCYFLVTRWLEMKAAYDNVYLQSKPTNNVCKLHCWH